MAQLTGMAGRSRSHTPAFVAATLFVVAAMATVILLALALSMNVGLRDGVTTAPAGAIAPVTTDDGRLDAIEDAYIKAAHLGSTPASRAGVTAYDGRLDAIEQTYIDDARTGWAATRPASVESPASDSSAPQVGQLRTRNLPR